MKQEMSIEYILCPLCGEDNAKPLFTSRDRLMAISGEHPVVRCRICGLIYINPRPTFESLAQYYPPDLPINALKPVMETGRAKEKISAALALLYAHYWARWIGKQVIGLKETTGVLDVGCGSASFLYYLKTRSKCRVHGVDISPSVVRYVRHTLNIPIYEGTLAEADFQDDYFDLITMWHFIEHDLQPVQTLQRACALLKSDGYLVLETPNIGCFVARVFGDRWSQIHPRHQILYSLETMDRMLNHCGFQIIRSSYGPLAFSFGISTSFALGIEGIGGRQARLLRRLAAAAVLLAVAPVNVLVNILRPECIRVVAQKK